MPLLLDGALRSAELEARFDGALLVSLRHRGDELLAGLPRRGHATRGVPLLHPWANRLAAPEYRAAGRAVVVPDGTPRDDRGLPIHGVVRDDWEVSADGATHRATLREGAHPAFPFPHAVEVRTTLHGPALTITTTMVATGEDAVPVAFGFHPYLRIPGLPRERWLVELPAMDHLALDRDQIPAGAARRVPSRTGLLRAHAFDDGFAGVAPGATFAVQGGDRRIEVSFDAGFPCAQVFAPPEHDLVCFEPMVAPANALRSGDRLPLLAPGDTYTARFAVAVR
ncbi:MAG: aldose 1-epimerase [Solirubrobacterales bacterium]|nr:aldose 1-epimerase [Solirubrobacterales bacterium]